MRLRSRLVALTALLAFAACRTPNTTTDSTAQSIDIGTEEGTLVLMLDGDQVMRYLCPKGRDDRPCYRTWQRSGAVWAPAVRPSGPPGRYTTSWRRFPMLPIPKKLDTKQSFMGTSHIVSRTVTRGKP